MGTDVVLLNWNQAYKELEKIIIIIIKPSITIGSLRDGGILINIAASSNGGAKQDMAP